VSADDRRAITSGKLPGLGTTRPTADPYAQGHALVFRGHALTEPRVIDALSNAQRRRQIVGDDFARDVTIDLVEAGTVAGYWGSDRRDEDDA
jgi:hypothetical protein